MSFENYKINQLSFLEQNLLNMFLNCYGIYTILNLKNINKDLYKIVNKFTIISEIS